LLSRIADAGRVPVADISGTAATLADLLELPDPVAAARRAPQARAGR
jgi:hypothetical protein